MKKVFIPFALLAFILGSTIGFADEPVKEFKLKAAFLYKFIFFADWPEKAFDESESTISIGILGEDHFGDVFKKIEGESINGRKLIIRKFGKDFRPENLRICQILFISRSLDDKVEFILSSLKDYPVLTVSETPTFIESGGIISFVTKEERVSFEIHKIATERVGIKIRAQLLRVAVRVIEE